MLRGNFPQQVSLCRLQGTLLEDVLDYFQLTTLAIMISLIYASSPEILSQDAMACAKFGT